MPRQARLDCAGTLHHVMIEGLKNEGWWTISKIETILFRDWGEILFFQNNRLLFVLA